MRNGISVAEMVHAKAFVQAAVMLPAHICKNGYPRLDRVAAAGLTSWGCYSATSMSVSVLFLTEYAVFICCVLNQGIVQGQL
jgi:hypothetical protein